MRVNNFVLMRLDMNMKYRQMVRKSLDEGAFDNVPIKKETDVSGYYSVIGFVVKGTAKFDGEKVVADVMMEDGKTNKTEYDSWGIRVKDDGNSFECYECILYKD